MSPERHFNRGLDGRKKVKMENVKAKMEKGALIWPFYILTFPFSILTLNKKAPLHLMERGHPKNRF